MSLPAPALPGTFSVIICAYTTDRWDDLRRAVASVSAQTHAAHEIIVVIDGDAELHRRAGAELTGVAILMNEHSPGLSGARRTGAEHASGAILAFLDDDAVADSDWLEQLGAAFVDPQALGVGGLVEPLWQAGRPPWFPAEFDWVVGCTYAGMPVSQSRIRNPIGANMSVRADVFARAGSFDARLGRHDQGRGVAGTAEETEFGIRATLTHPGSYWLYEPRARVGHSVPPSRATWAYFVKRCRVEGHAKALLAGFAGTDDSLRSERAYASSALPRAVLRELASVFGGQTAGLQRAAAIIAGLAITTGAYLRTRVARRVRTGFAA